MAEENICLRIKICGGGCSGFQTKLDLDENYDLEKDIVEEVNGIKVVVDKRSALYTSGVTVDFIDGINARGFKVDIPAATSRCGCGSSFSM